MEFFLHSGEFPSVRERNADGTVIPMFGWSSSKRTYDLVLPGPRDVAGAGQRFVVQATPVASVHLHTTGKHLTWLCCSATGAPRPWESRSDHVVGRYNHMCPRGGHHYTSRGSPKMNRSNECVREIYHAMNQSSLNNDGLLDVGIYLHAPDGQNAPKISSEKLNEAKFALCLDGSTVALRLPELLRSGQLVMLDDTSPMFGYFYAAMQPWVHYVPIARDSFEDIFNVTRFLLANDALAQTIAQAGREFALRYVTPTAAMCYTKRMLDTYASLMMFTPRPLGPRALKMSDVVQSLLEQINNRRT